MKNRKGFTLIELLAVIIIIGIIMVIAIPSVTSIIDETRKKAYVDVVHTYTDAVQKQIQAREINVKKDGSSTYIPTDVIKIDTGKNESPYGEWAKINQTIRYLAYDEDEVLTCQGVNSKVIEADGTNIISYKIYNNKLKEYDNGGKTHTKVSQGCIPAGTIHEAYVVVRFDKNKNEYEYSWTSRDVTGHVIKLENADTITYKDVTMSKSSILSFDSTVKTAIASNNSSNRTDFQYDEVTGRSGYANAKVNLYQPNKELSGGSAALVMTGTEASQCFTYHYLTSTTIAIDNYDKNCGPEVEIPSEIDGATVTTISSYAFYNKGLTKVVIHDGVKTIESRAFMSNQITELYLPNTPVTIGSEAFENNKLTEINLSPNTTIGGGSFTNNLIPPDKAFIYKLNSDGQTDYTTLLGYAGTSKEINIPDTVNGVPLKSIAGSAFRGQGITSVHLPDTVESIGSRAFESCKLTSITWPSHLKTIGEVAFEGNQLTTLKNLPSSITKIEVRAFNANKVNDGSEYVYARNPDGSVNYKKIVSYAGANKSISIPDQVNEVPLETISDWAFYACGLTAINHIPSTVTSIGSNSFTNNKTTGTDDQFIYRRNNDGSIDYTTIISYAGKSDDPVIPATKNGVQLTTIGGSSFTWCGLKSVTIPEGVTTIGTSAFRYNSLTKVTLPSTITSLGGQSFGKTGYPHNYNKNLTKIIHPGDTPLNFTSATGSSFTANFAQGTVEHQVSNIEVVKSE